LSDSFKDDDFQSAPRSLESLFAFFVLFHVRHHKNAIVDAERLRLYASFILNSVDDTTLQLQKSRKLLEKEIEWPQYTENV